jgi:hypothetical protein
MAESLADKLKRLAAEKKLRAAQAQAQAVASVQPAESESGTESEPAKQGISNEPEESRVAATKESACAASNEVPAGTTGTAIAISGLPERSKDPDSSPEPESVSPDLSGDVSVPAVTSSEHPLAMQFAELEAALLAKDPEFKTILRQVHRHLGQDAELVTMMSEAEVQLVVTGMVVFSTMEIVEPAKEKAAKSAVAKAKKAVITADDL